ncbi:MAG: DUF4823 domain-containing protein [Deltaproteobacteria bacterium]|nr:DUF4823 domain-containing protein [Deltaproteobacteria bacterium]
MIYNPDGQFDAVIRLTMIVAILVVGCSSYQDLVYGTRGYTTRLPREAPVYVAVPKDAPISYSSGKTGDTGGTFPQSGQSTAEVIVGAFAKRASRVQLAPETQSLADALKQAKTDGFKVLVWPTLIHWTDRSEHRRDQIVVKLVLYDTGTRKALDSVTIRAKSVKSALASPKELLSDPVSDYVDSLYFGT